MADSDSDGDSSRVKLKTQRTLSEECKTASEKHLEEFLFGGADNVIEDLGENNNEEWNFQSTRKRRDTQEEPVKRAPAWKDEDDECNTEMLLNKKNKKQKKEPDVASSTKIYAENLRDKYVSLVGTPSWADLNAKEKKHKDSDDEDEQLLSEVGNLIAPSQVLPQRIINVKQRNDLLIPGQFLGPITTTEFHPHAQIALVAATKNRVGLYQVDGIKNALIQDIVLDNFPVKCAHFTASGDEIITTSPICRYFYNYNMISGKPSQVRWNKDLEGLLHAGAFYLSPDGKFMIVPGKSGYIHMLLTKTKEWMHTAKVNDDIGGITFNADGSRMFSQTASGEVYIWDMNTRDCIHKFSDDGCLQGSSISISPNQQYLASGSSSGVVNIYDTNTLLNTPNPKPIKIFLNLTTSVGQLKFNSTSEILAFSSRLKNSAIKMAHFPSMTVFSNFPTSVNIRGAVTSHDISSSSGFLVVGTHQGAAHLFRLMHYDSF